MRLFPRKKKPKDLPWIAEGALARRAYPDYATYVRHQRAKFAGLSFEAYEREFRATLSPRLPDVRGLRVLCLAARLGTEVRAFRDAGATAIGIDLEPGPRNPDVLRADFHRLPFHDATFDAAYSNSLDHALNLAEMSSEARRVLRPGGFFLVEAVRGSEEGAGPGNYESFFWKRVPDLIAGLEGLGWRAGRRSEFYQPWAGEQIRFERT